MSYLPAGLAVLALVVGGIYILKRREPRAQEAEFLYRILVLLLTVLLTGALTMFIIGRD